MLKVESGDLNDRFRIRLGHRMVQSNEWIPTTLIEMAAFCEKNKLDKAQSILLEAAALIYINFANQGTGQIDSVPSALRPNPLSNRALSEVVVKFRRNGTDA